MNRCASLLGLAAALTGGYLLQPTTAEACGGCFAPTGQPSVVTAHRMVVSISETETTLWDQFEYAGDPEDFVWVLPVSGGEEVEIELADQAFFQYLADASQVTLQGPFISTGGGGGGFSLGCASDSGALASSPEAPRVTVYSSEVVGPYETVVVGSEDAGSLQAWLTENGYEIPPALEPTIAHYVDEGMNFAILRLSPNAGVSQMQPVRVTTPGANVSFPLRMVAAGIADSVALELFVIAEGRWEAANFPNAEISEAELTYDANLGTFNYDEVADGHLAAESGRTWLTEFSDDVWPPDVTYDPEVQADWHVATYTLYGEVTLTRMRADLPASALQEDLILQASLEGPRPGFFQVDNTINDASTAAPSGDDNPVPGLLFVAALVAFVMRPRRFTPRVRA